MPQDHARRHRRISPSRFASPSPCCSFGAPAPTTTPRRTTKTNRPRTRRRGRRRPRRHPQRRRPSRSPSRRGLRAVEEGDLDDRVGVKSDELLPEDGRRSKKRVIKTLQRKNFMKIGRFEAVAALGFVTNDPFINRYLVGAGVRLPHHRDLRGRGCRAPSRRTSVEGDWKPITEQLVEREQGQPRTSRRSSTTAPSTSSSRRSTGRSRCSVATSSCSTSSACSAWASSTPTTTSRPCRPKASRGAIDTESRSTPPPTSAADLRVIFNRKSLRGSLEGRSMIYIETIDSTTLEIQEQLHGHFWVPPSSSPG